MKHLPSWLRAHWQIDAAGLASLVMLGSLVYLLAVAPMLERRREVAEQSRQLAAEQQQLQMQQTRLRQVTVEADETRRKLTAMPVRLRPVAALNAHVAGLVELASSCGMQVDNIEPGAVASTSRYQTVALRITGRGAYPQCVDYLARIRRQMPDTGVTSLEVSSLGSTGQAHPGFIINLSWHTTAATSQN